MTDPLVTSSQAVSLAHVLEARLYDVLVAIAAFNQFIFGLAKTFLERAKAHDCVISPPDKAIVEAGVSVAGNLKGFSHLGLPTIRKALEVLILDILIRPTFGS